MNYKVVDVFTGIVTKGNPVAVVLNASELSSAEMQDFARWTNLSETTFVIPTTNSEADYNVRIFTPTSELPFAGHPSLGTAHAVLEAGIVDKKPVIIQQCLRGNIEINVTKNGLQFGIDGLTSQDVPLSEVQDALPNLNISGQPQIVDAGPLWIVVEASCTEQELLDYKPDFEKIKHLSLKYSKEAGICVFAPHSSNVLRNIEMRTFAPACGVNEDPVCGSGNAAVAYYRAVNDKYDSYQGRAIDRNGRISIDYRNNKIWVGGQCVTGVNGELIK